ncbi:HIT family protein [Vitreoscilla stercoraria]|uniref:HIT family protein n=1 Tax=Vitreoscilla stercoraria TaxID=61 RepID=A0ABY4E7F6_VITST|nr:HIT family protein [Vitreoscilla stercoraria]UOO91696.1 HIT family protein [Vitreoscilla stercoraria]
MAYDNNNVFAKILRGEMPAFKVHEDEHVLAFMDIMPQADGHVLVIPKVPAVTLFELPADAAAQTIQAVQKIARGVNAAMDAGGVVLVQSNGEAVGQVIPHVHFHVIPSHIRDLGRHAAQMGDMDKIKALSERIAIEVAKEFV